MNMFTVAFLIGCVVGGVSAALASQIRYTRWWHKRKHVHVKHYYSCYYCHMERMGK